HRHRGRRRLPALPRAARRGGAGDGRGRHGEGDHRGPHAAAPEVLGGSPQGAPGVHEGSRRPAAAGRRAPHGPERVRGRHRRVRRAVARGRAGRHRRRGRADVKDPWPERVLFLSVTQGVPPVQRAGRLSIFSPATAREREANFESYWLYQQRRDGEILEALKDLTEKRKPRAGFQADPVRTRRPVDPAFHRNYLAVRDDPRTLDRRTLLLTFLYKFARHEWIGISAAWDETPTVARAKYLIDKISRYHLAEEFCHMRLFQEMFRTFGLEGVEWGPLPKRTKQLYGAFARLPGPLEAPPALVRELMGLTAYVRLDRMLDETVGGDP